MSTQDVAAAVSRLKSAVLSDPDLAKMVENVKTPAELAQLWQNARFREMHDKLVGAVSPEDVRAYLGELGDRELDRVTGGAVDAFMPSPQLNFSPRDAYTAVFFRALIG